MNFVLPEINSDRWLSLEDFLNEEWRDIKGYEGLYQVSNFGRIKSLERKIPFIGKYGKGTERIQYARIIRAHNNGNGYLFALLWRNNKVQREYVHRIVASAFIPNQKNLPQINHKDENKANNFAENLEWCSGIYNVNYGTAKQRGSKTFRENGNCRIILMYDLNGNFIRQYDCALDMEKDGISRRSAYNVCNHRARSWHGYVFRFESEEFSYTQRRKKVHQTKKVYKYDQSNNLIKVYDSVKAAEKDNGFGRNYLYSASFAGNKNVIVNNSKYTFAPI